MTIDQFAWKMPDKITIIKIVDYSLVNTLID